MDNLDASPARAREHKRSSTRRGYDDRGHRVGETHHRSTIPDRVVAEIRRLHEDCHLGYRRIAARLGLRRDTVVKLARYERRSSTVVEWRRLP